MTEQRRLAEALATEDEDASMMHRMLRRWGFHGSTLGFTRWLQYLIHLTDSFLLLATSYPNLAVIVEQFLTAPVLLGRLQAALVKREQDLVPPDASAAERLAIVHAAFDARAPSDGSFDASDEVSPRKGRARFQPNGVPVTANTPTAMLLEVAALALHSVWNGYTQHLCPRLQPATRVIDTVLPGRQFSSLWRTVGIEIDTTTPFSFLDKILGFVNKTPNLERLDADEYPNVLNSQDWLAFHALLTETRIDASLKPSIVSNESAAPSDESVPHVSARKTDRRWGNRSSIGLSDRELLLGSGYGISDVALAALAPSMQTYARAGQATESAQTHGSRAMAYILNVAMRTGKTPASAFTMRVRRFSDRKSLTGSDPVARSDELFTVPSDAHRWGDDTWWRPASFHQTGLTLQIQSNPPHWPEECVDFELGELFPLPSAELEPEVSAQIGELLGRSPGATILVVKHALAREMHSFNTNRAAIDFICGQPGDIDTSVPRGSLSHYIHPQSACVKNAYAVAQMRLVSGRRDDDIKASLAWPSDEHASMWIPTAAMRAVVGLLRRDVQAKSVSDVLALHEVYATWTLGILDAATGERVSEHPFHFGFDIDEEDAMAFLADKILVGSEARFLPLVQLALEQGREYQRHVRWLVARVRPRRPALADEIEVAMGWREADAPRGANAAGVFFVIRDDKLVPISTEMIDTTFRKLQRSADVAHDVSLDTRTRRRNIATFLANVGACGIAVEAFLGQSGDQHPYGSSSSWIPLERAASLRPLITRYMEVNGWTLLHADWAHIAQPRTPIVPMPAFLPTQEGYEGRSLSAEAARDRARCAVREVLDAEYLEQEEFVEIDEPVIAKLRAALARLNQNDPKAQAASEEALDELIEQWKTGDRYEIASRFLAARQNRPDHSLKSLKADAVPTGIAVRDTIRAAIRSVMAPEDLKNLRAVKIVDEQAVLRIKEQIQTMLSHDTEAQRKVLGAFSEWIATKRRRAGLVVTAASVNLARFAPGPVTPSFGRHLAIARFIRANAFRVIQDRLEHAKRVGPPDERLAIWLGVIAVLLPLCDGVLNEAEMPLLLDALQAGDLVQHKGQLQLRATVASQHALYDRTVDLTDPTAAAVLGVRRLGSRTEPVAYTQIRRYADDLVLRITGRSSGMTLSRLLLVMRPFWFLRWPGSVYASAVGEMECNAPPESSVRLLLGGNAEPSPTSTKTPTNKK